MSETMKIMKLKNYGIPFYIVNIWEKHYSPYLLPLQEDAVKKYGVLDWGEESTGLSRRFAPRNDKREDVCNDREIDSRFRGNYIRGSGNDIKGNRNDQEEAGMTNGLKLVTKNLYLTICHHFRQRRKKIDTKTLLDLIANQGFPIALSILLIFRIDRFMQEIVTSQKDGYRQILENTKEIHHTITSLNQQNREYCSLHFSEVQKELSAMRVGLGRIEQII